jgi:hypothetical protein
VVVEQLKPAEYASSSPFRAVSQLMQRCSGVVLIGLPQLEVGDGRWRPGTAAEQALTDVVMPTPWNQIEAGMAAALQLPMLVVDTGVRGGIFDLGGDGDDVTYLALGESWDEGVSQSVVQHWLAKLDT